MSIVRQPDRRAHRADDGAGARRETLRREAIAQLIEAFAEVGADAPLPAAFLSSFVYYNGDSPGGRRWAEETGRRLPAAEAATKFNFAIS